MKRKTLGIVALVLSLLISSSSFTVDAKKSNKKNTEKELPNIQFNIEKDTIISKTKDLKIYENPNSYSKLVGYLDKYHSAVKFEDVKPENGFIKIESADVTGWVEKDKIVDSKNVNDYILSHLNKFDTSVKTRTVKGLYQDVDDINDFELSYDSYVVFNEKGTPLYRTPTVSKTRKDIYDYDKYIRITSKDVKILTKPKDGVAWGLAVKGQEYKLLDNSKNYYGISYLDGETAYISKKNAKIFKKKVKLTNLSKEKFKLHQMYSYDACNENNEFVEVTFDDRVRYVNKEDVDLVYIPSEESSSCDIIAKDDTIKIKDISDDYVTVNVKNKASGSDVDLYLSDENNEYLVNLEDAEPYIDPSTPSNLFDGYGDDPTEGSNMNPKVNIDAFKKYYNYDYGNNSTEERNEIVNYALKWLGHPYVWGGTSLANGCDCSGFCMKVLQNFGKHITRTTYTQVTDSYGKKIAIKDIQPGDLIYYSKNGYTPYHVVMYIGGDKCVNASCRAYGICISDIKFDRILAVKNYID